MKPYRFCAACNGKMPANKRSDAETCSLACQKKYQRTKKKLLSDVGLEFTYSKPIEHFETPKNISANAKKCAAYRARNREKGVSTEKARTSRVSALSQKLSEIYYSLETDQEKISFTLRTLKIARDGKKNDDLLIDGSTYRRLFRNPLYNASSDKMPLKFYQDTKKPIFAAVFSAFCKCNYELSAKNAISAADLPRITNPIVPIDRFFAEKMIDGYFDAIEIDEPEAIEDDRSWLNWDDDGADVDPMELSTPANLPPADVEPAAVKTAIEAIDERKRVRSTIFSNQSVLHEDDFFDDDFLLEGYYEGFGFTKTATT